MSIDVDKVAAYTAEHPKSKCRCGHTGDGGNSQHGNDLFSLGHGRCHHPGCVCKRFTWSNWLPAAKKELGLK